MALPVLAATVLGAGAKKLFSSKDSGTAPVDNYQTPQVADKKTTEAANRYGRAALVATSPQGVLGSDPTGRRKLLGNSY